MIKIGQTLLDEGLINSEQLKAALSEQKETHDRLGDIFLRHGFITSDDLAPILAQYFHIPYIKLRDVYKTIKAEVIDIIPTGLAHRFKIIPVEINNKTLTIATFDPLNLLAIDTIKVKTGLKVRCAMASEGEIQDAIDYCYHHMPRMSQHVENFNELEGTEDTQKIEINFGEETQTFEADDQPVVQYVKSLIVQASNSRASDIHLQPKENIVDLRLRIDGVLYDMDPPPKAMLAAIVTRIKILSGLDIAERRLPQDGRFKYRIGKNDIDIRVSAFPTIYGESMVLRLLDTSQPLLGLEQLGFSSEDFKEFKSVLDQSYGLILVTGPTGSGKTTTLYTSLNEIKTSEKNIITLEDPVEYRLPFIQQSQVNQQIGYNFAKGLRSILRQDPDVIMVGEIRDQETAEIAIHAALTGHLVFSTLHTNDAAGAAVRLIKMGVEPFLITSSLLGIIAQRLIRTVCPDCKEKHELERSLPFHNEIKHYYKGKGCSKCFQTGYKGRKGIYELLIPNEEIRKLILGQKSSEDIRLAAQKNKMRTLRQVGIEKIKEGITTPEEILRVTQQTEEL